MSVTFASQSWYSCISLLKGGKDRALTVGSLSGNLSRNVVARKVMRDVAYIVTSHDVNMSPNVLVAVIVTESRP